MNVATVQRSSVRDITRMAERQIKTKVGSDVGLILCPSEHIKKSPGEMLHIIAAALNMNVACFILKGRHRDIVEMRFLGALLLRRYYPEITLKQIGLLFGGQDHTSVINALIRANELLDTKDLSFTHKYRTVLNKIERWLSEQ